MNINKLLKTTAIFLVLAAFILGISTQSKAFCVYNLTDIRLKFLETSGGGNVFVRFNENVNPNQRKCCNWKNKGCNKKGKRDSDLVFRVGAVKNDVWGGTTMGKVYCDGVHIKAGGWLVARGKNGNYYCETGYNP